MKHGIRVSIANLYTQELGNPAVPEKLMAAQVAAARKKRTALRRRYVGAAALVVAAVAIGLIVLRHKRPLPTVGSAIPEKSIAVLPFENRSEDKANDYFADGIQDEILTRLSKIADLKVISRTSTQHYKAHLKTCPKSPGNWRRPHLEGSVQKAVMPCV